MQATLSYRQGRIVTKARRLVASDAVVATMSTLIFLGLVGWSIFALAVVGWL